MAISSLYYLLLGRLPVDVRTSGMVQTSTAVSSNVRTRAASECEGRDASARADGLVVGGRALSASELNRDIVQIPSHCDDRSVKE